LGLEIVILSFVGRTERLVVGKLRSLCKSKRENEELSGLEPLHASLISDTNFVIPSFALFLPFKEEK
jgi:hypothetical protein